MLLILFADVFLLFSYGLLERMPVITGRALAIAGVQNGPSLVNGDSAAAAVDEGLVDGSDLFAGMSANYVDRGANAAAATKTPIAVGGGAKDLLGLLDNITTDSSVHTAALPPVSVPSAGHDLLGLIDLGSSSTSAVGM